jgi:DNA-binding MarR family transcriptional regulator
VYARASELGLERQSVYRALSRLERASLIKVDRGRGRCPIVTILEAKAEN